MRIVTWNSCLSKGPLAPKLAAASRLNADVLILQEVASSDACGMWTDVKDGYGISIVPGEGYAATAAGSDATGCASRVTLTGAHDFDVLAVWAHTRPTYGKVMSSIAQSLASHPSNHRTVVAGDFNTAPRFKDGHENVVADLEAAGFVSAYHQFHQVAHGSEPDATHFWRHSEANAFHIDYCFVPAAWRIDRVEVGKYAEWRRFSDHVPMIVDVTPRPSRATIPGTTQN